MTGFFADSGDNSLVHQAPGCQCIAKHPFMTAGFFPAKNDCPNHSLPDTT
jgi:hypothetical protein